LTKSFEEAASVFTNETPLGGKTIKERIRAASECVDSFFVVIFCKKQNTCREGEMSNTLQNSEVVAFFTTFHR